MTRLRALAVAAVAATAFIIPGCFDWGGNPCEDMAAATGTSFDPCQEL